MIPERPATYAGPRNGLEQRICRFLFQSMLGGSGIHFVFRNASIDGADDVQDSDFAVAVPASHYEVDSRVYELILDEDTRSLFTTVSVAAPNGLLKNKKAEAYSYTLFPYLNRPVMVGQPNTSMPVNREKDRKSSFNRFET